MSKLALYMPLEASPGKEKASRIPAFGLASGGSPNPEPSSCNAHRQGRSHRPFAIFDTFQRRSRPRPRHLNVKRSRAALNAKAACTVPSRPAIHKIDIRPNKPPDDPGLRRPNIQGQPEVEGPTAKRAESASVAAGPTD